MSMVDWDSMEQQYGQLWGPPNVPRLRELGATTYVRCFHLATEAQCRELPFDPDSDVFRVGYSAGLGDGRRLVARLASLPDVGATF